MNIERDAVISGMARQCMKMVDEQVDDGSFRTPDLFSALLEVTEEYTNQIRPLTVAYSEAVSAGRDEDADAIKQHVFVLCNAMGVNAIALTVNFPLIEEIEIPEQLQELWGTITGLN